MPDQPFTPDLIELTKRSLQAGERKDWDEVMGCFAPDAVWDVPELGSFTGRPAILGFCQEGPAAGSTARLRVRYGAVYVT